MTKEITKKEDNKNIPAKKYTAEETKKHIMDNTKSPYEPEELLTRFSRKSLPELFSSGQITEKIAEEISNIHRMFSLETGHALLEGIAENQRPLVLQLKKEIMKEFDCTKPSEIALADQVAFSYARKMAFSNILESNLKYFGSKYDGYRNFLSKEIDRAHRQFLSSLESLKNAKQPPLKVNLKSNNAFVGQNQQFNTENKINENK